MIKKILFILIMFSFLYAVNAEEIFISSGNVEYIFDSSRPLLKKISVDTNGVTEEIAENIEFFRLRSEKEGVKEHLDKDYSIEKIENGVRYHLETEILDYTLEFLSDGKNAFHTDISLISKTERLYLSDLYFELIPGLKAHEDSKFGKYSKQERAVYFKIGDEVTKIDKDKEVENTINASWVGFTNRYFCLVFMPKTYLDITPAVYMEKVTTTDENGKEVSRKDYIHRIKMTLSHDRDRTLEKNEKVNLLFEGYTGEKSLDKLEAEEISEIMDMGFFGNISRIFLIVLKRLNTYTGNWGLSIIALTILIRLILFPLNIKQARSMAKIQKLQPEMEKLKKKYKDDKEKLNIAIMELYKKNNANPFSGCLPLLIQLPILFALFAMLRTSVEIKGADFLWMGNLAQPDPIYVLPVMIAVSMYYMQKSQPVSSPQQKQMMVMMPVILLFISLSLPAGVLIYWFISNLVSSLQQIYVNKHIHGGNEKNEKSS